MMIKKRLINTVPESKKYIAANVICQWFSLAANIVMMAAIAEMLRNLYECTDTQIGLTAAVAAAAVLAGAIPGGNELLSTLYRFYID